MHSWLLHNNRWVPSKILAQKDQTTVLQLDGITILEPYSEDEKRAELHKHLNHPSGFYPTDETLCILASKVYKNDITGLPRGWVTIAKENRKLNGYDGAAFFHQEYHQLVISHRGTIPKDVRDLYADWHGVFLNKATPQIYSACKFALTVLKQLNTTRISISITGHSLGGWLAQISTFAIKYLTEDGENFRKLKAEDRIYHPHTVTFDSPGCKEMLRKMLRKYGKEPDLSFTELDITTYFMAPNRINCQNSHVGQLISFISKIESNSFIHTLDYHKIDNFLTAFKNCHTKKEILLWPQSDGLMKTVQQELHISKPGEYQKFLKEGNRYNNFHPDMDKVAELNNKKMEIPYDAREFRENVRKINIFTEREKIFLESWEKLKGNKIKTLKLNKFLQSLELGDGVLNSFLSDFNISKDQIVSEPNLLDIVKKIKWLFVYFPEASEIMKQQISDIPAIFEAMYRNFAYSYVQTLPKYGEYNSHFNYQDTIELNNFLKNKKDRILLIKTNNTKDEAFRVHNILKQNENYEGRICMFSFKDMKYLMERVEVVEVLASESIIDSVIIIDFQDSDDFEFVTELYQISSNSEEFRKKLVLITQKPDLSNTQLTPTLVKEPSLMDLVDGSFTKSVISLGNEELSLADFFKSNSLKALSETVPYRVWEKEVYSSSKIEPFDFQNNHFKNIFLSLSNGKVFNKIDIDKFEDLIRNYDSKLEKMVKKSFENVTFLITGATENVKLARLHEKYKYKNQIVLESTTEEGEGLKIFKDLCLKNSRKTVFRLHLNHPNDNFLKWMDVFDNELYVKRKIIVEGKEINEDELLKSNEKITLISNDFGMGKSATLMHLARKIEHGWIFWINLINAHNFLDFEMVNMNEIVAFLLKFSNTVSDLAKILLQYSLENDNSIPVYLFFDAMDEIQNANGIRNKIFEMLEFLKQKSSAKLFISTRTNFCKESENKLNIKAVHLKELSVREQIEFCTKFWTLKLSLVESDIFGLKTHAKKLLEYINESIDEYTPSFLGIPLQLKIISEIFQPDAVENISFEDFTYNLYELYSKFVNTTYDIYVKEKIYHIQDAAEDEKTALLDLKKTHRILGKKHLFPAFQIETIKPAILTHLNRIGLVHVNGDAVGFAHETFAQYFAAEWLEVSAEKLTDTEQKILFLNILVEDKYNIFRRFINDKFEKDEKIYNVLKFVPKICKEFSRVPEKMESAKYYRSFYNSDCSFIEKFFRKLIIEDNSKLIEAVMENFCHFDKTSKDELLFFKDLFGSTFLYKAMLCSSVKSALKLLHYWPDNNIKKEALTWLHLVADKPSFNSFSVNVLEKGAYGNLINDEGKNFLDIAHKHDNRDLLLMVCKLNENYEKLIFSNYKLAPIFDQAVDTHLDVALKLLDSTEIKW